MIQWTPEMEQTLLSAIIKFKPVGIHKHFRLVNIIKYLTNNSGVELSLSEILDKIKSFYDLESLEADLIDYEIPESEFSLPETDFESIIEDYRQATEEDLSREVSPIKSRRESKELKEPIKRILRSTRDTPKRKKK